MVPGWARTVVIGMAAGAASLPAGFAGVCPPGVQLTSVTTKISAALLAVRHTSRPVMASSSPARDGYGAVRAQLRDAHRVAPKPTSESLRQPRNVRDARSSLRGV